MTITPSKPPKLSSRVRLGKREKKSIHVSSSIDVSVVVPRIVSALLAWSSDIAYKTRPKVRANTTKIVMAGHQRVGFGLLVILYFSTANLPRLYRQSAPGQDNEFERAVMVFV